jgi:hypothetical protein
MVMNAVTSPVGSRGWLDYLVAGLFSLPSLLACGFVLVFVTPKLKQICADAGYDGGAFFRPMDIVVDARWWIAGSLALAFWLAEERMPSWRRNRRVFLAGGVFVLNAAVLAGLVANLVLSAMAGPVLGAKANGAARAARP